MSTLSKKMSANVVALDGIQPRAVVVPNENRIQVAVGSNHPWASQAGLQALMGSHAPTDYNPVYLSYAGTNNSLNYLGGSYVQNSATKESVQEAIDSYMQNGGMDEFKDLMINQYSAVLGLSPEEVKRKRARTTAPGVPGKGGGDGTIPENEPLSKTQMSGPKVTDYQTVARQMQQNNLVDEYALQGGPYAQNRNIPPNFLQRDPWTGRVIRGAGYSDMNPNANTKQLEIRHKTDMGGNMYNTSTPYASNRFRG